MNLYRVENSVGGYCFEGTIEECRKYTKENYISHMWKIKENKVLERKFAALEAQKNELWRVFKVPVFVDIKKMKLYIVEKNGDTTYIF